MSRINGLSNAALEVARLEPVQQQNTESRSGRNALTRSAACAALSLAALACQTPAGAQNFVWNGGFEVGSNQGWTVSSGSSAPDTSKPHTGSWDLHLTPGSGTSSQYEALNTVNGHTYFVTDWVDQSGSCVFCTESYTSTFNGTTLTKSNSRSNSYVYDRYNFTASGALQQLKYTGIYSAGGNIYVDDVTVVDKSLANSVLSDGGFEAPALASASFSYAPAGSGWTMNSQAGISYNGSGFGNTGNTASVDGNQVGFMQGAGSMSQTFNVASATAYNLGFFAAQRSGNQHQNFQVLIDGNVLSGASSLQPGSDNGWYYYDFITPILTAGSHSVSFVGLDTATGDNTAYIDLINMQISTPAPPSLLTMIGGMSGGLGLLRLRRLRRSSKPADEGS